MWFLPCLNGPRLIGVKDLRQHAQVGDLWAGDLRGRPTNCERDGVHLPPWVCPQNQPGVHRALVVPPKTELTGCFSHRVGRISISEPFSGSGTTGPGGKALTDPGRVVLKSAFGVVSYLILALHAGVGLRGVTTCQPNDPRSNIRDPQKYLRWSTECFIVNPATCGLRIRGY